MTNHEVAQRFTRIGDILEIQGENPFKVRAYRRAAETIDELVEPLGEIDARGGLDDLPGFGDAIVSKTHDFLTIGTTAIYERIKDSVPAGVVTIAGISGIGPKTAKALWDALGVTDVAALEEAGKEGRIQKVAASALPRKRISSKRSSATAGSPSGFRSISAQPYAERLARQLSELPEVDRAAVAGSVPARARHDRRSRSGRHDDRSRGHGRGVRKIPGDNRNSRERAIGGRWDLRHRPSRRSTAWQAGRVRRAVPHFSSGQKHNIELRSLAESEGLKISEHGIFDAKSGALKYDGSDEAATYKLLGLQYIPPELREGHGEIELARLGKLPVLVTEADFKGQLHCHSTYSDGGATVRQMAEAAIARGYEYIAITDHSRSLAVAKRPQPGGADRGN